MAAPIEPGVSLTALQRQLADRTLSAEALTAHYLDAIKARDGALNAFITLTPEAAMAAAADADVARAAGDKRPLLGLPIAHKDLFCTRGIPTTCASRMLKDYISPFDATVVSRCQEAGLISLGKTNLDEFAMGNANETSYFGPVSNPWDLSRTPGGSSGGSAAAVAAGLIPVATASDTGGSIRMPAAFCGLTGIKPSYGRISRYGMVAFASSLDQAGVIARTAKDVAIVLDALIGPDPRDATTSHAPWTQPLAPPPAAPDLRGKKIGIPEAFLEGIDSQCRRSFDEAIAALIALGAEKVEINLPSAVHGIAAYYVIACAEASTNLSRYDGVRYGYQCKNPADLQDLYCRSRSEGFGDEVKRRIILGTYALSVGYQDAYYRHAQCIRRLISDELNQAFAEVDFIATPTTPTPAFKKGHSAEDPATRYQEDVFTVPANLAGLPCISLPAPQVQNLPYGLHLLAPAFCEARLLEAGYALQQTTDWHSLLAPMLREAHA